MKHVIVVIKDTAVNAFMKPFFVPAVPAAVRALRDEVNSSQSQSDMFRHPEDFILFELGLFDDENSRFELLDDPRQITRAADLKSS